ncbi:MAG: peptidoglycan-binding domain-containing protein [Thermoanaerobaculia bacterium]
MPQTLSIGAIGAAVTELQNTLNQLPSKLAQLTTDGVFGQKTRGRVLEFQGDNGLDADGVVGPITWEKLLAFVAALAEVPQTNNLGRIAVVAVAKAEASLPGVAAKLPAGQDQSDVHKRSFRMGYTRLLKYFRVTGAAAASPTMEAAVTYLGKKGELPPMPHWCGIFALWAVKTAGMNVGNWNVGKGISSVRGFRQTWSPAPGDVGYESLGEFQHHFVIEKAVKEGNVFRLHTLEGNSPPNSNHKIASDRIHDPSAKDVQYRFYTCFE